MIETHTGQSEILANVSNDAESSRYLIVLFSTQKRRSNIANHRHQDIAR
jgi:hypothetical protein